MTKSIFSRLSGIATVSESMIPAFQELAGEKVKITSCGDSRFDSVVDKILSKKPNEGFTQFADAYPFKKIFLLASTYSQCDEIIIPTLNKILEMGYAIWIFPHKIDSSRIREVSDSLRHSNLPFSVYSEVKNPCKDRIILFDALGILAFAYFYGNLAYVGGALHNKVHNILEPAYFGLPLITGDKIFNSFDALQLREQKSLTVITTSEEFLKAVQNFSDSLIRENVGISNKKYVTSHTGASANFYNTFIKQ